MWGEKNQNGEGEKKEKGCKEREKVKKGREGLTACPQSRGDSDENSGGSNKGRQTESMRERSKKKQTHKRNKTMM